MDNSKVQELEGCARSAIISVNNNSRYVLVLDHGELATHGYTAQGEVVVLPGENFGNYFGGGSNGAGVEVYFRFSVWDCEDDLANLPDSKAKRDWVVKHMRDDPFGNRSIQKIATDERFSSRLLSWIYTMWDVPYKGDNRAYVCEPDRGNVSWKVFEQLNPPDDQKAQFDRAQDNSHNIVTPRYIKGDFKINSGKNVRGELNVHNNA